MPLPPKRETTINDLCDSLMCYGAYPNGREAIIPRQQIDAIKLKSAEKDDYIKSLEERCHRLEDLVNDHLRTCPAPTEPLLKQRNRFLREGFRYGHVLCADRQSGKSTAIYEHAAEVADQASCRVAIVASHKDVHKAEAVRRRLAGASLGVLHKLEFFGPNEVDKIRAFASDVMVDDWFDLPNTTRAILARNFKILAATGTVPFGASMPIQKDGEVSQESTI